MNKHVLFSGLSLLLCLAFLVDCRVPYTPPVQSTGAGRLVVEGYIDGAGPTVIRLSRTIAVSDTAQRVFETGAKVIVEDDHQHGYTLLDQGNGTYSIPSLYLDPSYRYRLHILTAAGKEYVSDQVAVKPSPPVDSISWKFKDNGVQIYADTHDPGNNTRYYRWEYRETWQFHVYYYSNVAFDSRAVKVVPRNDQVYTCWKSVSSVNIILGSSAKLSSDMIHLQPVNYIAPHDQRLSVLYSILVKQYALDTAGYNFWVEMQNNSENIGSIFDKQPGETGGNIHCVSDPSEKVIGYIGAGYTVSKRIFISNNSMPSDWNQLDFCPLINVPNIPDSLKFYFNGGWTPVDEVSRGLYSASYSNCADCTLSGTNKKPDFWP